MKKSIFIICGKTYPYLDDCDKASQKTGSSFRKKANVFPREISKAEEKILEDRLKKAKKENDMCLALEIHSNSPIGSDLKGKSFKVLTTIGLRLIEEAKLKKNSELIWTCYFNCPEDSWIEMMFLNQINDLKD